MRKVLYILGDTQSATPLLPASPSTGNHASVVFIQDAVGLSPIPATSTYTLADDAAIRNVTPSVPAISYGDLLRLIFEADSVVAL